MISWRALAIAALVLPRACESAPSAPAPAASPTSPTSAVIDPEATPTASASASAAALPLPAWVHEDPASASICPADMVLVDGQYFPAAGHRCIDWLQETHDRCRKYAPPPLTAGKPEHRRFCIDRFEYPNLPGVTPVVMSDWFDAQESCHTEGKRLCVSSEWTLACEGNEVLPYPYGYARDTEACNIDRPRPAPEPDFEAFSKPRKISAEVDRLDLRVTSGERASCVSPFGARDMTGNVDEWVINEHHFDPLPEDVEEKDRPYVSGLKGGYWGPIRSRCRPMTTAHNPWFRFYQVGFRCCADPLDGSGAGKSFERSLPKRRERPPPME